MGESLVLEFHVQTSRAGRFFSLAVPSCLISVGTKMWSSVESLLPCIPVVSLSIQVLVMTHEGAHAASMDSYTLDTISFEYFGYKPVM